MAAKLEHGWNFCAFAFYFCVMAGLVAGCAFLTGVEIAGPVMFFSGLWSSVSIYLQRRLMRTHLRQHGASHEFSPNLARIVTGICDAAGVDPRKVPLFDYSLNRPTHEVSAAKLKKLALYIWQGRSHAAATTGDMLMISEPLLKLLDDAEEKAVLSHEMAHLVLRHYITSSLMWILQRMVLHLSWAFALASLWQAGAKSAVIVLSVPLALAFAVRRFYPGWPLRRTAEERKQRAQGSFWFTLFIFPLLLGVASFWARGLLLPLAVLWVAPRLSQLVMARVSQGNEYRADAAAVALGGDPLALAMGLRKILFLQDRGQRKLFNGRGPARDGFIFGYYQLYASHPRIEDRVERLCQMAYRSGTPWEAMQKVRRGDIDLPADHDIPEDVVRAFNNM